MNNKLQNVILTGLILVHRCMAYVQVDFTRCILEFTSLFFYLNFFELYVINNTTCRNQANALESTDSNKYLTRQLLQREFLMWLSVHLSVLHEINVILVTT